MKEWVLCNKTSIEEVLNKAKRVLDDNNIDLDNLANKLEKFNPSLTTVIDGSIIKYNNSTLTSIKNNAFNGCTALTSVNLPSVTSIGHYAFKNCTSLTSVDLPSVTSIGYYAFEGCKSLTSIDLPSVTSIDSYAFFNSTNLSTIIIRSDTVCTLDEINAFSCTQINSNDSGSIYVPSSLVESYKSTTGWSNYANIIKSIEEME